MVVHLENFDGSSATLCNCRRTADDAAGVDRDSTPADVVWPSEARELLALGLSRVRDRSGDDVTARTTGRAGSMTLVFSCL